MAENMRFFTAVVTFNRKELLLQNINAQLRQIVLPELILIIDNHSTDGTFDYLSEQKVLNNPIIRYFNTGENLGGSGGFDYAMRKAFELGADVVCLMDDDGRPMDKLTFRNAMKVINRDSVNTRPFLLNSIVLCDQEHVTFPYRGIIRTYAEMQKISSDHVCEGYGSPFNGTFLNRKLADYIGYPIAAFFIKYDEIEYFQRSCSSGAYVGVIDDSRYFHPASSEYETKKVFGKTFINNYEAPWKEYYSFRNSQFLNLMNGESKMRIFARYLLRIFGLYLFDIPDRKTVKAFIREGMRDAFDGNLGKNIEPGQKTIK